MLFLQAEAQKNNNAEDLKRLSDCNIGHIVYELFGGGIESTTMSILWFIIYMIRHPEVSNEYCKIYEHHEIGCMIPNSIHH